MDQQNTIPPTHRELIQSLIDGTLSPIESQRINQLLRDDVVLREFYIRQIRTDELLAAHFELPNSQVVLKRPEPQISKKKHLTVVTMAVALGMAAAIALMLVFRAPESTTAQDDHSLYSEFIPAPDRTPVAMVSGTNNVNWAASSGQVRPGHWLSAGKIDLKEGILELSYDTGTQVLIKAPAVYYIEAESKGYLEKGSIKAHSSQTLANFEVETPNSQLIDLGTTFGVTVLSALRTEVHVIEGLVKAKSLIDPDTEWKMLLKGKALRIKSTEDFNTDYDRFPADTSLYDWAPPERAKRPQSIHYHHWSFDQLNGSQLQDSGQHPDSPSFPAHTVDISESTTSHQWLTQGRFGKALHLDGNQRFLRTDFPGIEGNASRTVAFWIRLGKNQPRGDATPGIVSWGKNKSRGEKWQIRTESPLLKDNQQVIRTECAWGHMMGQTNLHDGQWHHVASVFMSAPNADIATHVKHYVDGKLETRGSIISRRVNTAVAKDEHSNFPLSIGLSMDTGFSPSYNKLIERHKKQQLNIETLNGDVDELYIFDAALTPSEILQLMQKNRPPE
ncbi:hypothetical protein HW115_13075 [Verrucomicrobiaceae bacterium N1E253]|uniref:FecR protein domain-containing protein n=1 Tax=Oceaniferula marina TaxID=2748318 RepID=A0A851GND7_9BACT|nr:LamG-like jellyroll fold domain-containing protein [Oceaniferula marina]NWK56547.1 hypothetical protein [Oceaniferula marina]